MFGSQHKKVSIIKLSLISEDKNEYTLEIKTHALCRKKYTKVIFKSKVLFLP